MSKHKILSLFLMVGIVTLNTNPFVLFAQTPAQTGVSVLLEEDFETVLGPNLPAGWSAQGTWGTYYLSEIDEKVVYGDAFNYPYTMNQNIFLKGPSVALNNVTNAQIKFDARCDTEYAPNTDYMTLNLSANGSVYNEVLRWNEATIDTDGSPAGWAFTQMLFEIPAQYLTSTFAFQFGWVTNATDNAYDGCSIDKVMITTNGSSGEVDTTPPVVTIVSPTATSYTNGSIGVQFTLNEAGSCTFTVNNLLTTPQAMTASNGNKTFNASLSNLTDGSYVLRSNCADIAGNSGIVKSVSFNVITQTNDNTQISFTAPLATHISGNTLSVSLNIGGTGDRFAFLDLDESLKFWMTGENENGSITDASQNDSVISAFGSQQTSGKFGNARLFDGITNYLGVTATYDELDQFTNSLWVNPHASNPDGVMLRLGDHALQIADNTTLRYYDGERSLDIESAVTTDEWNHFVVTGDGEMMKIYVNGELRGEFEFSVGNSTQSQLSHIGKYYDDEENQTGYYRGKIDEVIILGRAITNTEVKSMYDVGTNAYVESFPNLSFGPHTIKGYSANSTGTIVSTNMRTVTLVDGDVPTHGGSATTQRIVVDSVMLPYILGASSTVKTILEIPSTLQNSSIIVNDFATTSTSTSGSIIGALTIEAETEHGTIHVSIPSMTTIISGQYWDGIFQSPKIIATSSASVQGTINLIIHTGSESNSLSLNRAVRILLPGMAGKKVAIHTNEATSPVTALCSSDTQDIGDSLASNNFCMINVGDDLVVWTKHLSNVVAYSPISVQTPTRSSGGGGGGGGGFVSAQSTLSADLNNDGVVNMLDFNEFMMNWGKPNSTTSDLNRDGKVDLLDFNLLMINWIR